MKKPNQTESEKLAKRRAANKKWKAENPEKVAEMNRKAMKRWRAKKIATDPEFAAGCAAANKKWREENPEKHRESSRRWQTKNPVKLAGYQREYHARRRAVDPEFRKAERSKLDEFLAKVNPPKPSIFPTYYDG